MGRLDGKIALVTGGASGIGKCTAEMMIAEGAKVAISDINDKDGEAVAAALGDQAIYMHHDVTDPDSWSGALRTVVDRFGGFSILVNNVGWATMRDADIESETMDGYRKVMAINLDSVYYACRAAIPVMREHGGGSIVNVSSLAALLGTPTMMAYGAAKAGMCQMTKTVAIHCANRGDNIRCNSVHPALINTPLGVGTIEGATNNPERAMKNFIRSIPVGRMGEPRDIAQAIVFLSSDESALITAAEFPVDGGMMAT